MFQHWRRRRAIERIQPGDGRELKPFRWWQLPGRALFYLRLAHTSGEETVYAVDVRHWQNQSSGEVTAQLYLGGRQHAAAKLPAFFPVHGGTIEVAMSNVGVKRCHYVTVDGDERQLVPDPASAEGRRARLEHRHPVLSRSLGWCSASVLVVALLLLVAQLAERITAVEPIAQRIGTFHSPVQLPVWLNVTLVVVTLLATTERALRLRHNRLLDGAAG